MVNNEKYLIIHEKFYQLNEFCYFIIYDFSEERNSVFLNNISVISGKNSTLFCNLVHRWSKWEKN